MKQKDPRGWMRILLFCLIGVLLLGLLSFIIDFGVRHSYDGQIGKINGIMDHSIDPQVIAFGASTGEVGIDPAIITQKTNLTCFNGCIDGTRFLQYEGLIKEFNQFSRNNKIVILSEAYFSFEKIEALTSIERYMPHLNNENIYQSLFMIQPDLTWKCRHIPFYKFIAASHVYYKNSALGWKNYLHHYKDSSSGYEPVDRGWEADADLSISTMPRFSIQFDTTLLREYAKTIGTIQHSGRQVVILLTPVYSEALQKVTDISPLRNKLDSIASLTNAHFLDFTTSSLCRDKNLFYNSLHLNRRGSQLFTEMLGDSLAAISKHYNL